jgi:hypothetical protein
MPLRSGDYGPPCDNRFGFDTQEVFRLELAGWLLTRDAFALAYGTIGYVFAQTDRWIILARKAPPTPMPMAGGSLFGWPTKLTEIHIVWRNLRVNCPGLQYLFVAGGFLISALRFGEGLSPVIFLSAQAELLRGL